MIFVSDDLKRIVTTNVCSGTVSIIEKSNGGPRGGDWDETVVPVGKGSEGFDLSLDRREIWTANASDGTVSIIDVADKKVTQTLAANVTGANRLKFTPNGKTRVYLLAAQFGLGHY
jgi:DNA-binding beta-propeller fold protein YncE